MYFMLLYHYISYIIIFRLIFAYSFFLVMENQYFMLCNIQNFKISTYIIFISNCLTFDNFITIKYDFTAIYYVIYNLNAIRKSLKHLSYNPKRVCMFNAQNTFYINTYAFSKPETLFSNFLASAARQICCRIIRLAFYIAL